MTSKEQKLIDATGLKGRKCNSRIGDVIQIDAIQRYSIRIKRWDEIQRKVI